MTYKELLEKRKKADKVVDVLGFSKFSQQAKIVEVNEDWAVIEFVKDDYDERALSGIYAVPFSVIVIKNYK